MNWIHRVDIRWLMSRRDVLTASEVVRLIPEWKRVKAGKQKRSDILPMCAALWAEKNTATEPDPVSVGPAARGHYMEPYAVETVNRYLGVKRFHHWDDCVVKNLGLGFSPDAMDIRQEHDGVECSYRGGSIVYTEGKKRTILKAPHEILEIKSYLPDHHMRSILKDRMDQDEIYQIAVAFAVIPDLEKANLVFYCPDSPYPTVLFEYSRDDLAEKVEQVLDVAMLYHAQALKLEHLDDRFPRIEPVASDAEVWRLEMSDKTRV